MSKDYRHNRMNALALPVWREELRRRRLPQGKRGHRSERRAVASELRGVRLGVE